MASLLGSSLSAIDLGAVGGSLLGIDLILFACLAIHWEEAGHSTLFSKKRPRR